ncbi:MAG: hypothetical protein ABMB14_12760 [Myxococcota bacterium]
MSGLLFVRAVAVAAAQEPDDLELEVEDAPAPAAPAAPEPVTPEPITTVPVAPAPEPAPEPVPAPAPVGTATAALRWWERVDLRVSGYVQPQVTLDQQSEDEVDPDGGPLNQDRFEVRRGRLRVDRSWRYARASLELDANTTRGPYVSVRRAEVSAFWSPVDRGDATEGTPDETPDAERRDRPPVVALTAGLTEIPFGYELVEGNGVRPFMERTTGSTALFPGEPDTGVTLSGGLGPVRYAVAVMNGVPLSDRPGGTTDVYTARKTWVGRVGFATRALSGGVSLLEGAGFHAGTAATKSLLQWRDTNQDGLVTLDELVAAPGQAQAPSAVYDRWAVNADVQLGFDTPLGHTALSAEATLASNLDRGLYVADPISTGYDLRESAWTASAVQDLTRYGLVGFRADRYDPNADWFEARRGVFVPEDASILTLSPIVGVRYAAARVVLQYDYVVDQLGRDLNGNPVDLPNDAVTVRLQVAL